ncbi:hypothetical protein ABVK25_008158 [Lepraria finkii]|uniref:Acyl-CoA dehydrogenase/oxidase N-terminal domain-containing protein n=1 Tax=Lepraria finkii TaxID=1340010 RepID=A0ABR4B3M1_9LECA
MSTVLITASLSKMSSFSKALRPLSRAASHPSSRSPRITPQSHYCLRPLATTPRHHNVDALDISSIPPTPISHMSDIEAAMADSVRKFATEEILPNVRSMDEAESMDPALVEQLFEQGLMGIEIPEEFGGAGMNFTAGIVGIEE